MNPVLHARMLTSSDGCQIYADAIGDPSKPCFIFIHGFTLSAAVFDNIFLDPHYSSQFYLVRYDMRGHGRSGKPDAIEEYSSKLYADDFAAVLHAFHLHRPVVVAWSLGGTVVADIATHLPANTMAGVVYLAACPCIGPIMQAIGTPFILNLLTDLVSTEDPTAIADYMQQFFNACFKNPESVPWELRTFWQGMSTYQRPRHRRFALTRSQDSNRLQQLGAQGLPVLVVIGTADPQINANSLRTQSGSLFSNMEFVALEGAGHALHYEHKDEVMSRIVAFSQRLQGKQKTALTNKAEASEKEPGTFRASRWLLHDVTC